MKPVMTAAECAARFPGVKLRKYEYRIIKKPRQWGQGSLMKRKEWLGRMQCLPGVFMPLRTKPEGNQRSHWRADSIRVNNEKYATRVMLLAHQVEKRPGRFVLTRYSPRLLDEHDNLRSSFKHIVDAIAAHCGKPDNDPAFTWEYRQEITPAGCYGVRIEVHP